MTYFNEFGQARLGWRIPGAGVTQSTLSTSIYAVWNADTTSTVTTLGTGTFAAWNAEDEITTTQLSTSLSNVWQGGNNSFPATNYSAITTSMSNLWKADNNTTDSIGGLVGTSPSGSAPTFTTGKLGTSAFLFDGINDFIKLPVGSLQFTGDFTISLWFKPSTLRNGDILMTNYSLRSSDYNRFGWEITLGNGTKINFTQANNSVYNTTLTSSVGPVAGVWQLLTIVRTAATSKMYLNGSLVGQVANTISLAYNTNSVPTIGAETYITWSDNTTSTSGFFNGAIDEIGMWTRGLSNNEVIGLYEAGNGQTYPYSNSTTVVSDSYGTSYGILRGGATYSTGKIGNALLFNGSSYVDLPVGALDKTSDFSVSLWIYPTANNTMTLISSFDGRKGWQIQYLSGNLWFWGSNGSLGGTPTIQVQTGHSIVLNTWTHLLVTVKNSVQVKTYINGVLTNTVSTTGKPITYNYYSPYYLPLIGAQRYFNGSDGNSATRDYFTGKLDAIALWDRELTSIEASAIYNSANGNEYPFSNVSMTSSNDALGNYNGTNNGVTFTTGKTGTSAFSFNGSSNYIALPQAALNFNKGNSGQSIGDFSVSFWVNLNTGSGDYQTVISNWGSNGVGWQVLVYGGSFIFFAGDGSNGSTARIQHSVGLSNTNAINQWVHVVVTYTNQSQVKSYVNGVLRNTSSTTYQVRTNSRNNGIIGAWPQEGDNSGTKYWYLNGKLDAVTLWTKALTDAEASALYNNGTGYQYSFPSSATGYLSSYNDAVGSNHGTTPASTITNGVPGPTFTAGKIGQAFTFDGINDFIQLPDNSLNLTGAFSYSFWSKSNDTTNYGVVVGNVQSPNSSYGFFHGYEISFDLGKYLFFFRSGYNTQYNHYTTNVVNNGNWNHIVVTYNPNNLTTGAKIYVNGTLNVQGQTLGLVNPIGYSSPMKACIGARNHSGSPVNFLPNGTSIDALSSWNKELSATEITELYNAGAGKQYPY